MHNLLAELPSWCPHLSHATLPIRVAAIQNPDHARRFVTPKKRKFSPVCGRTLRGGQVFSCLLASSCQCSPQSRGFLGAPPWIPSSNLDRFQISFPHRLI